MIDLLIDWLSDWLINWLIDWLIGNGTHSKFEILILDDMLGQYEEQREKEVEDDEKEEE